MYRGCIFSCVFYLFTGLVTYKDGTHGFPRNEGYFQDCRLLRHKKCPDLVQRAQKIALMARTTINSN